MKETKNKEQKKIKIYKGTMVSEKDIDFLVEKVNELMKIVGKLSERIKQFELNQGSEH